MTLLPLVVISFWIGLYPAPFLRILDEPVRRLVSQVDKTYVPPAAIGRGGASGANLPTEVGSLSGTVGESSSR